jgi:hypothetical protein
VLGALSLVLPPLLEDGVVPVRGEDKGATPAVPPEDGLLGAVVCGVRAEEESGAATGGGDRGATGATRGAGVPTANGAVGADGAGAADGAAGALEPERCPTAALVGSRTARLTAMPAARA